MKINIVSILFVIAGYFFLTSCEQTEGEGGTSEIVGKVFVQDYNSALTVLEKEYYAQEEDVYIIYGNDNVYTDRFRTHFDGTFRFQYLRKGKYSIYAYSKDMTGESPTGMIPSIIEVEISKNYQTITTEDIVIIK